MQMIETMKKEPDKEADIIKREKGKHMKGEKHGAEVIEGWSRVRKDIGERENKGNEEESGEKDEN